MTTGCKYGCDEDGLYEDIAVGRHVDESGRTHIDACWHDDAIGVDACPACIGRTLRELVEQECSGIWLDEDTPMAEEACNQIGDVTSEELEAGITLFSTDD